MVFHILTTYLGSDDLLGTVGKVLGVVFEWLYLATLVTCFVLALGNRPGGSNKFYMTMVYFWIGIMIYLAFAAVFVTVKSIQKEVSKGDFTFATLFTNTTFFSIIVSLGSTYVMWFIASFIFLDPWHMFTSVSSCQALSLQFCSLATVHPIHLAHSDLHQRAEHLRIL